MILIAGNHIGRVHHAAGNKHLQKTRPTYCFVPEEFFHENGLAKRRYLASRWPSINCTANPFGIGSHIIPNLDKPVSIRCRCPVLAKFLQRLEQVATVKNPHAAA